LNRLLIIAATVLAATALMAQNAGADSLATSPTTTTTTTATPTTPPAGTTEQPATGVTVTPTPAPQPPTPPKPTGQGKSGANDETSDNGVQESDAQQGDQKPGGKSGEKKNGGKDKNSNGATAAPDASAPGTLSVPLYPSVTCGAAGAPIGLLSIYQGASDAYGLGPQGPAVLAAINGIESGFGANLGPSSAGAVGWMQFLPSTWSIYGVDANGDGTADPNDPHDAIYAAARYLRAAGMPTDTPGAIFAYNHADWYVAEVLANAGCYGAFDGAFSLTSGKQVIACTSADDASIPERYLQAFEQAASQYDLGKRGVWALAGVARLESNFGTGMTRKELRGAGPLGLDRDEWNRFEVDGDGDGLIRHASIEDSAATLAREVWSRGDLRSGLFLHNQASWYVEQVLDQKDQLSGGCKTRTVEWNLALPAVTSAPINWANLTLSNPLEMQDIKTGALDPRIMSLLGMITQTHQITVSALRSDHSEFTAEGNVSNHFFGRAVDIGAVDGVPCTNVDPSAPCGELGRTLTLLPTPIHPTELIYCFDLDGPGPAFARADHCDHIHVGFDG
jgi:membrane-bound lytic murein transglycosylase B